jgi:hypothetical protein
MVDVRNEYIVLGDAEMFSQSGDELRFLCGYRQGFIHSGVMIMDFVISATILISVSGIEPSGKVDYRIQQSCGC